MPDTVQWMLQIRWFLIAAGWTCLPTPSSAQSSADDIATEPNQQSDLPSIEIEAREPLKFLAGTQFIIKPRAYYMDRDRDKNQDNVGFALGGAVQYSSGWAFDRLQLRALYGDRKSVV